jgi:hypothetical protein
MPVPWWLKLRFFGLATDLPREWESIKAQLESEASRRGMVPYSVAPTRYRFHGWGVTVVGPDPRLAVNVLYYPTDREEDRIDLGRFVGE